MSGTVTGSLVDLATGPAALPASARIVARHCLLDWLGVAIAGTSDGAVTAVVEEALDRDAAGRSPVIGRTERLGLLDAALANGVAGHVLDYDDAHQAIRGHGTAPILPATLALAERHDLSLQQSLDEFAQGVEACARVSIFLGPAHYLRGFHTTGTAGTFGAVIACSRLMGLDGEEVHHAIGIAASMSAGLVANFGSMSKALNVGRAAMNGLHAARLAARGFTASPCAFEGPGGFVDALGAERACASALELPASGHHLPDTLFKMHASCFGTHSAINAALAARARGATPGRIAAIHLRVPAGAEQACSIANPTCGLEVKFSLPFLVAMALHGVDTSDPAVFTDALPARSDLRSLAERVMLHYEQQAGTAAQPSQIEIHLADGRIIAECANAGVPETDLGQQQERLETKFAALATPRLGRRRVARIVPMVLTGEAAVREMLALCTPDA